MCPPGGTISWSRDIFCLAADLHVLGPMRDKAPMQHDKLALAIANAHDRCLLARRHIVVWLKVSRRSQAGGQLVQFGELVPSEKVGIAIAHAAIIAGTV